MVRRRLLLLWCMSHAYSFLLDVIPSRSTTLRLLATPVRSPASRQKWNRMVQRLKVYQKTHGTAWISRKEDPELYQWAYNIRRNYKHQVSSMNNSSEANKRPRLNAINMQQLEEAGFIWERPNRWEEGLRELTEFYKEFGHVQVSKETHGKLYRFVQNQRSEYRKKQSGQATPLTAERQRRLEEVGMTWAVSRDKRWREHLEQYQKDQVDEAWCKQQRIQYRIYKEQGKSASSITEERVQALEEAGFVWNVQEEQWLKMLHRLKEYESLHGHIRIPTVDENNRDLRLWLSFQRLHYHRKKTGRYSPLSKERVRLLESIPNFCWKARDGQGPSKEDWSKLFTAMRDLGITPKAQPKLHWFDGENRRSEVKSEWTDEELMELWNEEDDEDDDWNWASPVPFQPKEKPKPPKYDFDTESL